MPRILAASRGGRSLAFGMFVLSSREIVHTLSDRRQRMKHRNSLWTRLTGKRILCPVTLSARNRLEGQITELQLGGVMAHVVIRVGRQLHRKRYHQTQRGRDETEGG